jgi:hypothetical protein
MSNTSLENALMPTWSIAIFARNEQARIKECLIALADACVGVRVHVTLLVNGTTDRTCETAKTVLPALGMDFVIYEIEAACKSHAINLFVHELRPPASLYFFVDAATFVERGALRALATALRDNPAMLAASGLPRNGRSAEVMRRGVAEITQDGAQLDSRLFGQMFAVKAQCLDELRRRGRRLPIGLYRGDGLFAGFLCRETNGVAHEAPINRVLTVPGAQWRIRPVSLFRAPDVRRGLERLVRQARGRLENQAWNPILWQGGGFGALPRFADDMILDWLKTHTPAAQTGLKRLFTRIALHRIRTARRPTELELVPRMVAEGTAGLY